MTAAAVVTAVAVGAATWSAAAGRAARAASRQRLSYLARPRPPRRVDRSTLRRVGIVLALAAAPAVPIPAALAVAALTLPTVVEGRRRRAADDGAAVAVLPEAIDLLAVAANAGLPAPSALAAVAERAPPPWGPAFLAVLDRGARGERFVDALDELVRGVGDTAHPLRSVLRGAAHGDIDLVAGLARTGADARDVRRRRAEEAARRIPVRLLLPLVACSLPAFALLSIVPIVAGALQALDL